MMDNNELRGLIREALDQVTVDALVTKQHAELADELSGLLSGKVYVSSSGLSSRGGPGEDPYEGNPLADGQGM